MLSRYRPRSPRSGCAASGRGSSRPGGSSAQSAGSSSPRSSTARARTALGALPGGDAPAAILYTSGSTGRPKGILVSHANLRAGARIVASYLDVRPDERILSVLPFSFDYGLNQLLTAVERGSTLVLQRSHFPGDLHRALAERRITALAGVPALWIQWLQHLAPEGELVLDFDDEITAGACVVRPKEVAA